MSKRGLSLLVLAWLSVVPTSFAVDHRVSGLSRPRSTELVRQTASTACPFRRFPWPAPLPTSPLALSD